MTNNLYIVLIFAVLCILSVFVSVIISKANAKKMQTEFKIALDKTNKSMSDSCSVYKAEIDNIKNDVNALKEELKNLPDTITVDTDEKLCEMKDALSLMENKLNILDSTVKNIERMKDVELKKEDSDYFYSDEPRQSKVKAIKEKVVSGYEKSVEMTKKIDVNTVVKTAPDVIKVVKKLLRNNN